MTAATRTARLTWLDLVEAHQPDFDDLVHVRGLLADTSAWSAALEDAFSHALDPPRSEDPRVRVYRDSMLDYRRAEHALSRPWPGTGLRGWFEALADGDEVCVAFNECDRWSPTLTELVSRELVSPMTSVMGDLGTHLEWYSFVGASGWTPFGIHRDPEVSMIFHLGPEPKEVWVWSPDDLSELPGRRPLSWDVETHLVSGRHVVLAPGDFLSIPAGWFHVFRNSGFSAFLGLMIHPQDPLRLASESLMDLAADQLRAEGWADGLQQSRRIVEGLGGLLRPEQLPRLASRLEERSSLARSRRHSARPPARRPAPEDVDLTVATPCRVLTDAVVATPRGLHARGRVVRLPTGLDAHAVAATLTELTRGGTRPVTADDLGRALDAGPDQARAVLGALETGGALLREPR